MASIEDQIRGSYVKYDRLAQITYETYGGSSIAQATELNIYIDLYSILHSIFSESGQTLVNNYTDITSTVINMVGHYREFFKRMQVKTKFFLIFSYNTCDINRKFVAEYNEVFREKSEIKKYRKIADDNFNLMNILCPYLPDVFFIKSIRNYEVGVIMSHLIDKYGQGIPNLIISRDIYPIQLCAMHPYTSYLRPVKNKDGDQSVMISINEKPSFRYDFWKFVADFRKIGINSLDNISPLNFSLAMALNKFPERNIKDHICMIQTAIKLVWNMIQDNEVKILPSQLYSNEYMVQNIPVSKVESRMNALDIGFMRSYYDNDPESKSIKLDNLRDDGAVNSINAKFFRENPINLSLI